MDRYKTFHRIITGCDPGSHESILQTTLNVLVRETFAEIVAYYPSPGNPRALAVRDGGGTAPGVYFPHHLVSRAMDDGKHVQERVSRGKGPDDVFSQCFPLSRGHSVEGVVCLSRRTGVGEFGAGEIEVVEAILEDIQGLIDTSTSYQRQSYELDEVKSMLAMKKVHLVSEHPSMLRLFRFIRKLARVPSTVLVLGESGTGKELVVRALYELGEHRGPFLSINCGGIEVNLLKSELFGHVNGAFTDARQNKTGLFQKAENGVLFMDEIGDMPMEMQVALLRTLESGEVLPVGSETPTRVNTRVVAATHRNLEAMVAKGEFRNDLYQRIKGLTLRIPPLRERSSDIPILCGFFLQKYNQKLGTDFRGYHPEALALLERMAFRKGNVRELEHLIERAMVFEDDPYQISTQYLLPEQYEEEGQDEGFGYKSRMDRFSSRLVREALAACGGNKSKAMKLLNLPRSSFYNLLEKHGFK